MQKAYKAGDMAGATSNGVDIMARIAAARLTSAQNAGSDGAPLVTSVLACTNFASLPFPTNFDASTAIARGIFEVRTSGSTTPAFAYSYARDETNPIDPYQGGAVPLWGVEGTWPAGPTGFTRYLVFGYPLGTDTDVRNTGFELGTFPAVNVNGLAVAVCASAVDASLTTANLLLHSTDDILLTHNAAFCANHMTASTMRSNSVMQRLVRLITPKIAIAQERDAEFIGGLPSGWSPFHVNHYTNTNSSLTFSEPPGNTNVYTEIEVQVTAALAQTTPVVVTLTVFGNNGQPTSIVVLENGQWVSKPSISATTVGGVATFHYGYSKAGGYTLQATGSLGGTAVSTPSVLSPLFQIKNK